MTALAVRALRRLEREEKTARPWEALPPDLREDFEERAAILEYEAGFPREEAERRAFGLVKARNAWNGRNVSINAKAVEVRP